jgi:hypothetical protein
MQPTSKLAPRVVLALLSAAGVGCETTGGGPGQSATTQPSDATPGYGLPQNAVTLVNLHPDEERSQLYSVNYQMVSVIPRCTPVTIDATSRKGIKFTVTSSGRQYDYAFHDTMVEGPEKHLARYFGAACPEPTGLNPLDMKGIESGLVSEGMTKTGVILALGYPPEHATPSPDRDQWIYWKNRWDRFVVRFADGIVVSVQN